MPSLGRERELAASATTVRPRWWRVIRSAARSLRVSPSFERRIVSRASSCGARYVFGCPNRYSASRLGSWLMCSLLAVSWPIIGAVLLSDRVAELSLYKYDESGHPKSTSGLSYFASNLATKDAIAA